MHPVQLVTCPRVAPGQLPIELPVPGMIFRSCFEIFQFANDNILCFFFS